MIEEQKKGYHNHRRTRSSYNNQTFHHPLAYFPSNSFQIPQVFPRRDLSRTSQLPNSPNSGKIPKRRVQFPTRRHQRELGLACKSSHHAKPPHDGQIRHPESHHPPPTSVRPTRITLANPYSQSVQMGEANGPNHTMDILKHQMPSIPPPPFPLFSCSPPLLSYSATQPYKLCIGDDEPIR